MLASLSLSGNKGGDYIGGGLKVHSSSSLHPSAKKEGREIFCERVPDWGEKLNKKTESYGIKKRGELRGGKRSLGLFSTGTNSRRGQGLKIMKHGFQTFAVHTW